MPDDERVAGTDWPERPTLTSESGYLSVGGMATIRELPATRPLSRMASRELQDHDYRTNYSHCETRRWARGDVRRPSVHRSHLRGSGHR